MTQRERCFAQETQRASTRSEKGLPAGAIWKGHRVSIEEQGHHEGGCVAVENEILVHCWRCAEAACQGEDLWKQDKFWWIRYGINMLRKNSTLRNFQKIENVLFLLSFS